MAIRPAAAEDIEFEYSSRTMTAEQILADIEKMEEGVEGNAVVRKYGEDPDLVPAKKPDAAPPGPQVSPVPPEPSGDGQIADEDEEDESPASESGTEQPHEAKKKGGFQKRIAKLTSEADALKSQLADRDRKLADAEARLAAKAAEKPPEPKAEAKAPEPAPPVKAAEEDPEPQPDTYDDYADYLKAVTRWTVRDERRQAEAAASKPATSKPETGEATPPAASDSAVSAEAQEIEQRWQSQMAAGRLKHPDLDQVFSKSHPEPVLNPTMWNVMRDQEDGVDLGYWLASHPEEAVRIQKLTLLTDRDPQHRVRQAYHRAAIEFDRIRAKLAEAGEANGAPPPAPEEKPAAQSAASQTAAPAHAEQQPPPKPSAPPKKPVAPPIKPVGSANGPSYKRLNQMTAEEIKNMPDEEYRHRIEVKGEGS